MRYFTVEMVVPTMSPPANDSDLGRKLLGTSEFGPREMDELFDLLSDTQRRRALGSLSDAGGTMPFDELVDDVARQTIAESPSDAR